jgi:putative flippase GtrA
LAIKQVTLFLLVGGIAAGLNWASRFVFSEFFRFEIAVVLAFLVGLTSGFFLMRRYVFTGGDQPVVAQAGKYLVVNLFALVQTLVISLIFARWLLPSIGAEAHAEPVAHLIGVLMPVVTSYFGHKLLTFRK